MRQEPGAGACPICGAAEQGASYCGHCGASLLEGSRHGPLNARVSSRRHRPLRRPRFRRRQAIWAAACLAVLLPLGGVASLGFQRVPNSGICFANPLDHTSLWPYDPASGTLRLSYAFRLGPPTPFRSEYAAATRRAFQSWSAAWPVLRFQQVGRPGRADIVVRSGFFGTRGFWYDHAGLTIPDVNVFGCGLSHATIEVNNSYLVHGDLLQYPLPMLRHLLLHEIGHALGLKHVYRHVASVMVPTSDAYRYDKPQNFDIRTISALYPLSPHISAPGLGESGQLRAGIPVGSSLPRRHKARSGL